ncbi:hypothetical protein [Robiginitalea aurantiaca]|uniref:Uncharacterized protein n=1 Tax=Robiginitalea aurantiaca TaxID=3056915 RepID=A0ABT7WBF9_9FLAO|nr:hypothetical protein [Robiginitalea aurantiaca]MDM9630257.1 hypothetical protein [Robiginitalea aurantiaca]
MSILGEAYLDLSNLVDNYFNDLDRFSVSQPNKTERDYLILLRSRYEMQLDFLQMIKPNPFVIHQDFNFSLLLLRIQMKYYEHKNVFPKNQRDDILNICFGDLKNPNFNDIEYNELISKTKDIIESIEEKLARTTLNAGGYDKYLLDKYIWEDKQKKFIDLDRKFRDRWNRDNKSKKYLIHYLHHLINNGFFQEKINGSKAKAFQYKQFLSLLYFNNKTALSDAYKKYFKNITKTNNEVSSFLGL